MIAKIDNFSRNLASGMSRRKAFWQLLAGAGGLGLLATQKASANAAGCPAFCFQQASVAYNDCIEDSLEVTPPIPFGTILIGCLAGYSLINSECMAFSTTCKSGFCASVPYTVNPGEIDITGAAPCVKI